MKRTIAALLVTFAIMVSAAAAGAAGIGNFKNYSADMVITASHGSTSSRVYATNLKQRMEMKTEGQENIVITRFDRKKAYMCMKAQKMCMEMPLMIQKQDIQSMMNDPDVKVDRQFLSNETVDGHATKKYHIVITRNGKSEQSGFMWEAADLNNFPVKWQSEDKNSTITWKNISFSSIPDGLFEIPQGYKKMEMNMSGMGAMGRRK